MDEANRKVRFHHITTHQESSIRDYVLSLDIVNKNAKFGGHLSPRLMLNSSTSMLLTSTPASTALASTSKVTLANALVLGDLDEALFSSPEKRSAPKLSHRKSSQQHNTKNSSHRTAKVIEKGSIVGVDCCDVKISYWFREDAFQNLFFQTLMLILCISRWLITRAELNLNQRSLILVISVATAADTLDFFGYLSMQMVYTSWHLLYSVLLIVSLSLVQFVFLHVEDDCLTASSAHAFTSANNTVPTKTGNSLENDGESGRDEMMMPQEDEMEKKTVENSKKHSRFSLFNRQYRFLKRHLSAEEKAFNNGIQNKNKTNYFSA